MSDKWVNYSDELTQTKQQISQCVVGTFLMHRRTMSIHRLTNSPWSEFGGSHHLPPYSILYDELWGLHPNVILSQDSQVGSFEIPKIGTFNIFHNFFCKLPIKVRFKAKL
jgi:hypothetical protein